MNTGSLMRAREDDRGAGTLARQPFSVLSLKQPAAPNNVSCETLLGELMELQFEVSRVPSLLEAVSGSLPTA